MRLIIRDLKKTIGDKTLIDNASYSFRAGITYGIVGKKNSGKTDFLKCLCGEYELDDGYVKLEADWVEYDTKYSDFGFVSENCVVPEFMTGYEFFESFKSFHNSKFDEKLTADDYFDLINISPEMRGRLIKDYSVFDKRRIQLLSILVFKPSVIILDDPLKNSKQCGNLKKIIELIKDRIIIIATRNPVIAKELCDECIYIRDGKINNIDKSELDAFLSIGE